MKQLIAATVLSALAISGCSSLPDSVRGPFANLKNSVSDVDVHQAEGSPFPQETDEGKF
jgi:starvation-inducible outer membrane lipoprotein